MSEESSNEIIRSKMVTEVYNQLDELLVKLNAEHQLTYYELRVIISLLETAVSARFDQQVANHTLQDRIDDYEESHHEPDGLYK